MAHRYQMIKLKLVCGNCGRIEHFEADTAVDAFEAAFRDGWDALDRFGYNACWECPGVAVYFPQLYAQHARDLDDAAERELLLAKAAADTVKAWPKFPKKTRP